MSEQLWGWLGQTADPLSGKLHAERLLIEMLGMERLKERPPSVFAAYSIRKTRLDANTVTALRNRFGADGFSIEPDRRAAQSLGQSYPDQLARRAGTVANPVDAVVFPANHDDALDLLTLAQRYGFCVLAAGGGTNVTGGFTVSDKRPLVVAHMRRMQSLQNVNEVDLTAQADAGIMLPELEVQLNARGFTLGHFPQSFHGVTLGGALAAHGSGQRSNGYGRVSDMVLSAILATPRGTFNTEAQRHSATGPWLGGLIAGSEGQFGLITSVRFRVSRKPEVTDDRGWLLPSFGAASAAARQLVQSDAGLTMIRVSDGAETNFLGRFRLAMKGLHEPPMVERLALKLKRAPVNGALVIAGFEGDCGRRANVMIEVQMVMRKHSAVSLGSAPGASWRKGRYDLPYLRESLLRRGIGVDTFETAVSWSRLAQLKDAVGLAFDRVMAQTSYGQRRGVLMCHLSHSYREAACLYFTALFVQSADPLDQWRMIKEAISQAITANGGAVSHHHGVGSDHAKLAIIEKGEIGLDVLRAVKRSVDPENILVSGMSRLFG